MEPFDARSFLRARALAPLSSLAFGAAFAAALGVTLAVTIAVPGRAEATPFTLPAQRLAVDLSYNYDEAGSQWTVAQQHGPFPLNGHFSSSSVQLGVRYGILDNLEVQLRSAYKIATYYRQPDPPVQHPGTNPTPNVLDDQVFNFSGQESGVGDIYAGLSYRPFWRHVNAAIEAEIKIPYRLPRPHRHPVQAGPARRHQKSRAADGPEPRRRPAAADRHLHRRHPGQRAGRSSDPDASWANTFPRPAPSSGWRAA